MRIARSVAVLLTLAAVASGCTSGHHGGPAPAPPAGIGGRTVPGGGPTLGAKWDWSRAERFTPYLGRLPAGATFSELVWCDVEPERGRVDWSTPDRVVRSARRLGYAVFLKLRVGSCWATPDPHPDQRRGAKGKTASAMPADLEAYRAWVDTAVRRYAPLGVHEYAIENEVNAANFWADSPAAYERLAAVAAAAVRAADPRALVVDCGISSTAYGVAIADDLLRRGRAAEAVAAAAVRAADPRALVVDCGISSTAYGVAIADDLLRRGRAAEAVAAYQRYYSRRFQRRGRDFPEVADEAGLRAALARPEARRSLAFLEVANRLARQRVVDVRQLHFYESWDNLPALLGYVRAAVPPGFPLQAWEVGMFWPGGNGDATARAGELVKTVSLLLAAGVRPLIWLPLAFDPGGRHADEPRYGLLEPDGRPRPAAAAFQRLADAATGATSWEGVTGRDLAGVVFGRGGSSALVVWSERGAALHLKSQPGGRAEQVTGGQVPWGREGLQVGAQPLLITLHSGADGAALLERAR
jgi:hypothetical protein